MLCRPGVAGNTIEQNARRCGAELIARLVHGCECGTCGFGEVQVVEPYNRDVFRTPQAHLPDGYEHTDGDHIVGGEDRGGAGQHAEQNQTFRIPTLAVEGRFLEEVLLDVNSCVSHGTFEPRNAVLRIGQMQGAGDYSDVPVAHPGKQIRGSIRALFVSNCDTITLPVARQTINTHNSPSPL